MRSGDFPCLSKNILVLIMYLKSASLLANGGKNSAHNLSTNSLLADGLPSMRLTFPVKNNTDGRTKRKSVEVMALSSTLREIREEMLAVIVQDSSPETSAPANAGLSLPAHEITLCVRPNAPQPERMLRDSRRLVFPLPLGPRIRLRPGPQLTVRPGLV